jgi:hypothetical protein
LISIYIVAWLKVLHEEFTLMGRGEGRISRVTDREFNEVRYVIDSWFFCC